MQPCAIHMRVRIKNAYLQRLEKKFKKRTTL